jgi:hypothetical protein
VNAVKDVLESVLRILGGLLPREWSGLVSTVAGLLAKADWGESDSRWGPLSAVVADLIRDIEQARALEGIDLSLAARAAAEVRYTRALRDLGLLEGA